MNTNDNIIEPDFGTIDFPEFDPEVIDSEVEDGAKVETEVETELESSAKDEKNIEVKSKEVEQKPTDIDPRYETHYNFMVSEGYLKPGDDFKFDGNNIEEAYKRDAEIRTNEIAQSLINSIPEKGKELINYILNGGDDLEGFFEIHSEQQSYANIDVSNPENAKEIIKNHFKKLGVSEKAIEYTIEGFEISETLEEEAAKIKESAVLEAEKQKTVKIQEEIQHKEKLRKDTENYINQATTFLNETKWANAKKKEVMDSLFKADDSGLTKTQSQLQYIFSSPKSAAILTDILLGYDSKKDEWSFKRIEDSLSTKVTEKVKNNFDEHFRSSDSAIVKSDANSNGNIPFNWDNVEII